MSGQVPFSGQFCAPMYGAFLQGPLYPVQDTSFSSVPMNGTSMQFPVNGSFYSGLIGGPTQVPLQTVPVLDASSCSLPAQTLQYAPVQNDSFNGAPPLQTAPMLQGAPVVPQFQTSVQTPQDPQSVQSPAPPVTIASIVKCVSRGPMSAEVAEALEKWQARRKAKAEAEQEKKKREPVLEPLQDLTLKEQEERIFRQMYQDYCYKGDRKKRTNETSVEMVAENLTMHRYEMTSEWKNDMLPEEKEFETVDKAISYAMYHAMSNHYQLVSRYDETSDTWLLNCDRMCESDQDKDMELTVRGSCLFQLKITCTNSLYLLQHCHTTHNHHPSVHPKAHLQANMAVYYHFSQPKYEGDTFCEDKLCKGEELPTWATQSLFGDSTSMIKSAIRRRRKERLEGLEPVDALKKLLQMSPLKGSVKSDGTIFFAHTDAYRLWKTYPEVAMIQKCNSYKPWNGDVYHLYCVFGRDCYDRYFVVCSFLTKEMTSQVANWGMQRYKELLDEFKVPYPTFLLTNNGGFCGAFSTTFPEASAQMDQQTHLKEARDLAKKVITSAKECKKAVALWNQVIKASDESAMRDKLKQGRDSESEPTRSFFEQMENEHLHNVAESFRNKKMNFFTHECIKEPLLSTGKALNIFELVRAILLVIIDQYEVSEAEHGVLLVASKRGYGDFFEKVVGFISHKILEKVKNEEVEGECVCVDMGYPCGHVIQKMRKERRILQLSDFHSHYRNMYGDVYEVAIGGGRYEEQWKMLRRGLDCFDKPEEERAVKRVRVE